MATEQPEHPEQDKEEVSPPDPGSERKTEDGATVEEESEQSFPASDPPSY
jgi:hypothetical protein